ncbi:glycosyltransferase [Geomonas sp. Red69]|uniref:glycosyltransferase family 2 protein n=1 Tax=Geomonas diazotrophica TaxID=2843197 RepID=UPI001C117CE6|nr:glycosyltransferase [Geomonas diazotrophica]MBU5636449.1 glycosyltransferase [Geomonas diazotrophica]
MTAAAQPKVTVLMPVYNGELFLREAIDSILAQSFAEFELLVIDDGSSDASAAIAASYADSRLRLIQNGANLGLIETLNRGIELARGEYILRMDCDDVSLPERLRKQVDFMDRFPEVGVCGVWYLEFGPKLRRITRCAADHESIRCGTLFNPVVGHPSVILRRKLLLEHGLRYDPAYRHAEDYQLWSQALQHCRFANIPEVLLHYRVHPGQVTAQHARQQMESAGRVRLRLIRELGIEPDAEEFEIHQVLSALTRPLHFPFQELPAARQLERIDRWLCKLKEANDQRGIYPEPQFSTMLVERWVGVCLVNFVARGIFTRRLFTPPGLFALTGSGLRRAGNFVFRRLRTGISDSFFS